MNEVCLLAYSEVHFKITHTRDEFDMGSVSKSMAL